jgi:hypothetical protein
MSRCRIPFGWCVGFHRGQIASPGLAGELWPIRLFCVVMLTMGIKRYRQTLD